MHLVTFFNIIYGLCYKIQTVGGDSLFLSRSLGGGAVYHDEMVFA